MKRLKGSLIVFAVSTLICVPLLAFIKNGGGESVLNYVLYVAAAAAALLMLVFSLSSPEYPSFLPSGKRSVGAGLSSLIAAVAYGGIGIYGAMNPEKRLFGVAAETVETTVEIGGEVTTQVASTGRDAEVYSTIGIVYIAIMIVMAVTFLFYAFGFFSGQNYAGSYVMVPFIPILGSMVRVVLSFLEYTSSPDMSANYLDTLTMIFLMLFFVSSAKLTVGSAGSASKWAVGTGCAAMFFALLKLTEPVIALVNKEQELLELATGTHAAVDLATVFFIAGYCIYIVNTDAEDYLEEIIEDEDEGYGGPVSSSPTLLTGGKRSRGSSENYIPEIAMVQTVMPSAQTKAQGPQVAKSGTAYSAPVPPRRDGVTAPDRLRSRQREGYSAPVPPRRVPIGYRLEADELTTKGAGMQVAEQFRVQRNEARRRTTNLLRYDGLDAFRAEMKGGRTALDVLESSRNAVEEDTSLVGIKPINPFQQGSEPVAEASVDPAEAQQMGEELQKDVEAMYDVADRRKGGDRRKGENVGGRRSTDKQPEQVIAAPDESAPEYEEEEPVIEEPANEYRDVKLSGGSLDSKMKKRRAPANADRSGMQQNPYQQNMNGMNMGMGYGMGMGMGYGMGMGMNMNNPYDPYAGMGMNNPYANPYNNSNPYAAGMGQMPYGSDMYHDESEEYDDDYYYDDDYDVETAASDEYDGYEDEEADFYEDEYDEEYYDDDNYVEYDDEYGDEYDEYDEYGDEYDGYDDYDEGDEYYGDDDEDYYDDDDGYGTYNMSAQGWE